MNFETTPGELWASANRRSFLKNGERCIHLELGSEGKFPAKSSGWDENRVFPRGRQDRGRSQERPLGAHAPARVSRSLVTKLLGWS
jgi:hypothetical protein